MNEPPRRKSIALKLLQSFLFLFLALVAFADITTNGIGHFLAGAATAAVLYLFWLLIKDVWTDPEGDAAREPSAFFVTARAIVRGVFKGLLGGMR
jgi:hypothetical protein